MKKETKNPIETNFQRFRKFTQEVISVPKSEIDRREAEYKKTRAKLKKRKL
jgi:hypothetical protein